jgi:hypothetical protein
VNIVDNLPPSSADVTESRSVNLPELSGPHRPVMGLLLLLLLPLLLLLLLPPEYRMIVHIIFTNLSLLDSTNTTHQLVVTS